MCRFCHFSVGQVGLAVVMLYKVAGSHPAQTLAMFTNVPRLLNHFTRIQGQYLEIGSVCPPHIQVLVVYM